MRQPQTLSRMALCALAFCLAIPAAHTQLPPNTCANDILANGHFQMGLVAGSLAGTGSLAHWAPIPLGPDGVGLSAPEALAEVGCSEAGAVLLRGTQTQGNGVLQAVGFIPDLGYRLSMCAAQVPGTPPNARLRFRATNDPSLIYQNGGYKPCDQPDCEEIWLSPLLAEDWATYTAPVWVPVQHYTYLVVTVWNDSEAEDPALASSVQLDDLCVQFIRSCTECAVVESAHTSCSDVEGCYDFAVQLENFTDWGFCDATAVISGEGLVDYQFNCNTGLILGRFCAEVPFAGGQWPLAVQLTFPECILQPGVPISCTFEVPLYQPCCEVLSVADTVVCAADSLLRVPLVGGTPLAPYIRQVDWYLDVGCGGGFLLYQSTAALEDLLLFPSAYADGPDSLCVYATLTLAGHSCQILTTEPATVGLCRPESGTPPPYVAGYCANGAPVAVQPLVLHLPLAGCDTAIQWYLDGLPIEGANGLGYQPDSLAHVDAQPDDCATVYGFEARVDGICGTRTYPFPVTIFNGLASPGSLVMSPEKEQPFCPGEDATLLFAANCTSDGWHWYIGPADDETLLTPLLDNGSENSHYHTNQRYQSTWYEVRAANGVCPVQRVPYSIAVRPRLEATLLITPDSICEPSAVTLLAQMSTPPKEGCQYVVKWYCGNELIHTALTDSATASYGFLLTHEDFGRHCHVVVEDSCCDQTARSPGEWIRAPLQTLVQGPCFRCNEEPALMRASVINRYPGYPCAYQWYRNGEPIPGATQTTLWADQGDVTYRFEATCGTCVAEASRFLRQCGTQEFVDECDALAQEVAQGFAVHPVGGMALAFGPVAGLQGCDEVTWEWGDGTLPAVSQGTDAVRHYFRAGTAPHTVVMSVRRMGADSAICVGMFGAEVTPAHVWQKNLGATIQPNPSDGVFRLRWQPTHTGDGPARLRITDLLGRPVAELDVPPHTDTPVDIRAAGPGLYTYVLEVAGGVAEIGRVVVQ